MRKRITYANVAATLALVFSMTGGAIAAQHYLINSTKQINPKVLKKLKGKNGATGKTGATGLAGAAGAGGATGKTGSTGERGPSTAFNQSLENILEWPATANEPQTVLTVSLPAGNFFLSAEVLANNNAATQTSVHCELLLGATVIDAGFDHVNLQPNVQLDRAYLVLSGVGSLSSPGTATVVCQAATTEGGNYLNRSLSAIQVGSLG